MKIKSIFDEKIVFDNGYELSYYHVQDCCENVYADFKILKTYNLSTTTGKIIDIYNIDFNENIENLIECVKEQGFNMVSKIGEKFFIPCYNEQNGYYNDKLELILGQRIDITDSTEEKIY